MKNSKIKQKVKQIKFPNNHKVIFFTLIILFIVVISLYIIKSPSNKQTAVATRIIDGDTFEIESGEKVRLICVDAPEQEQEGYEAAKQFLEDLILNKTIKLQKDVSDKDKYNRLLRYVYVSNGKEEVFVNKLLVQEGHAEVFRYEPDISKCDEIENIKIAL